jgi:hypothetical protein
MNGYDYKLKEKQVFEISSVASGLDDLRSELSATSNENTKRIENELACTTCSIQNLTSSVVMLNNTLEQIAKALESNK